MISAFAENELLQVLFFAVLFGLGAGQLGDKGPPVSVQVIDQSSHIFFTIVGWIMKFAPLGAFGAMAFIIGQYGIGSLASYGKLIGACYLAAVLFILILALVVRWLAGVNLWKFLVYIKDELFLALGTASTEVVLPRIMVKLDRRRLLPDRHRSGRPDRVLLQPRRRHPVPVHLLRCSWPRPGRGPEPG